MMSQFRDQPQKKNKWSRKHARQYHDTDLHSSSLKRLRHHHSREENDSFIAADSASSSDTDLDVCLLSVSC